MMDRIKQLLGQFESRTLLVAVVVILLILNASRMVVSYYNEKHQEIIEKAALLEQQKSSIQNLNQLKNRVAGLKRQKQRLEQYLFIGKSEEEISSAIQIKLQDIVTTSELEPEYIRPVRKGDKGNDENFGEISVNVRLSGTIDNFADFLKNLYNSKHLFKIESFSVKPFKETELKIVLEVKGYYKTSDKS